MRVVGLRPLSLDDSRALLERRGLRDPAAIEETARWAAGSPLSLIVGADALLAGQVLDLKRLDADGAVAEALIQRLAGDELEGADREVLAVAAIARAVDARMLAACCPASTATWRSSGCAAARSPSRSASGWRCTSASARPPAAGCWRPIPSSIASSGAGSRTTCSDARCWGSSRCCPTSPS